MRMPFGLCSASYTFQRTMDVILSTIGWQFALVYLDNTVNLLKPPQEHIGHARVVLALLHNAGVALKIKKE